MKQELQQSDLGKRVAAERYMIGPELDKSGRGFHSEVVAVIRS